MTYLRLTPLFFFLASFVACGDGPIDVGDTSLGDAGAVDARIMFDIGPEPDAISVDALVAEDVAELDAATDAATDASADTSDASISSCAFSFEDGLSGCGQACTFDTRLATGECGDDYACFQDAWTNDTTPSMPVTQPALLEEYFNNFPFLITGQLGDSFCFRCTYYAALYCWHSACPDETIALLECLATTPGSACRPLSDTVSQCAGMDPDFRTCYGERINACY